MEWAWDGLMLELPDRIHQTRMQMLEARTALLLLATNMYEIRWLGMRLGASRPAVPVRFPSPLCICR